MPALGAVDPADLRAQARAELGLSRELAQPRRVKPHPCEGGSSGYPVWSREEQLEKWNAGEETAASEAGSSPGEDSGANKERDGYGGGRAKEHGCISPHGAKRECAASDRGDE
jgi:hypothetical protein